MSTISGKVTDFGGSSRLVGKSPQLSVVPSAESSSFGQLLSTVEIPVDLDPVDNSFSFNLISSDELRPPLPYGFRLQWLNGEGIPVGQDLWSNVWVPDGAWDISDLLGAVGVSQTQIFWQATEPDPFPIGSYWANTITGDVNRRKA